MYQSRREEEERLPLLLRLICLPGESNETRLHRSLSFSLIKSKHTRREEAIRCNKYHPPKEKTYVCGKTIRLAHLSCFSILEMNDNGYQSSEKTSTSTRSTCSSLSHESVMN